MSKDISNEYTKMQNKECGRRGYGVWKSEKDSVISPKKYGEFLMKKKHRQEVR